MLFDMILLTNLTGFSEFSLKHNISILVFNRTRYHPIAYLLLLSFQLHLYLFALNQISELPKH